MAHWLFKTEPDVFSIDDLARQGVSGWDGIRNYQARNRLRDEVKLGDRVFIYHSSCAQPAVVGLAEVCRPAYPDSTQFDPANAHYDGKSSADAPRWVQVDVRYLRHLDRPVTLREIKASADFSDMELVSHGRLSIQRVSEAQAQKLLAKGTDA
jgi:predicted RNA-binding protein with PUA-like domain